jgi:hypothetical protein
MVRIIPAMLCHATARSKRMSGFSMLEYCMLTPVTISKRHIKALTVCQILIQKGYRYNFSI